jgi:predicted enzyme related to lactoylglutathione lyase
MRELFYNCLTVLSLILIAKINAAAQPQLKPYGVQINVTNIGKAIDFYTNTLNFKIQKGDSNSSIVLLKPNTGNDVVVLNKVSYLLPVGDNEAKATLTLQVNNLDSAIARLNAKGVNFNHYQKRKEGVGYAVFVDDPFGTRLSLMHETVVVNPYFEEPQIYNYGFYVPDMDTAKAFFTSQLGFVIRSEKYLPLDLPLGNSDKSFAFMVHTRNGVEAIHYNAAENEHIVILFKCEDINKTITELRSKNIKLVKNKVEISPLGKTISFYDPFGYISKLVEVKQF